MVKKSIPDMELSGKTVLLRADFNVPFHPGSAEISDDSRIRATLPTLRHLLHEGCRVVACSHLGRPKGEVVEHLRMAPVASRLRDLSDSPVVTADDCVGPPVKAAVERLAPGETLMLENLRFHAEEEANDPAFAQELASVADVFVNDAFGAAHRAHASTVGVTEHLPAVAGMLMARELEMLGAALSAPKRPCVAVLGGAKVSDKLAALVNLAGIVDTIIVGGGMAATFLKARGLQTGHSLVEDEWITEVARLESEAAARGRPRLLLPTDVIVADAFEEDAHSRVVGVAEIPPSWYIMDVGPETVARFQHALEGASTVVWNGPLGVAEWKQFASGTERVARTIGTLAKATTVIGGGSTAETVGRMGLAARMTHVSTGGGASLEFLEGKTLPGVAALLDRDD